MSVVEPSADDLPALDDHRLAARLAAGAGQLLMGLRRQARTQGWSWWDLESQGDAGTHELLMDQLRQARPGDAVLSEEGVDDRRRLQADRVWIVDPLDGSYDFSSGSPHYAVHVALVSGGKPLAAAVAVPEIDQVFVTGDGPAEDPGREEPVIVTGRSQARWAMMLAHALGGTAVTAGSAGVKAAAVVQGTADVYLHPSGLYEWDSCAPAAVAEAAGLVACDLEGEPLTFNKSRPVTPGLLIARRRFVEPVLSALR